MVRGEAFANAFKLIKMPGVDAVPIDQHHRAKHSPLRDYRWRFMERSMILTMDDIGMTYLPRMISPACRDSSSCQPLVMSMAAKPVAES
jgi:hypothetical protein